jgi:undecaprenyl-diphosphatase
MSGINGLCLLAITSIPVGLVGLFAEKFIEKNLHIPLPIAAALAVGALWILVVEYAAPAPKKSGIDSITWKEALAIGFFQCFALWPGMSRSASTILGGMITGLDRKTATEYSFFAAVPIMLVATAHKMIKIYPIINRDNFAILALGFIVSFIFAWLAVKFLLSFLSKHTLVPFAWYRLVLAALVVVFYLYFQMN